jgi:predicted CXXCH cytochrome family protein
MKAGLLTLVVLVTGFITVTSLRSSYEGTREGRADANYIDSKKCIACHDQHYESWLNTFHSRMTQDPKTGSVQGDFERDNTFEYQGIVARMEKRDGSYFISFLFPDGRRESNRVVKTVGSRRIEQYVTEQNGQHRRLPVAYDLLNRRWIHLNGSFFHPDGRDYFQLAAPWDPNCVFCHNVKAQPGLDRNSRLFKTEVSELGIACGACHGSAATHADRAASPFIRTQWRLSGSEPRQIVNPKKLDAERSVMICGHCHGQRFPEPIDRIQEIMSRGDPFNAGEDLNSYYRPVWRETKLGNFSFAPRFWENGSPRLTAYEYQGLLRSACFIKGEPGNRITCLSCHSMHEGDPRGQILKENLTNKPCLSCHQQYEPAAALTAHTGHRADSDGSRCYSCHMPRVVYGIMSIHPTHEITVPDPRLTASQKVPNACNQCHLDRSVNWAIAESGRIWPGRFAGSQLAGDPQFNLAEGPRALFAGDALTRAIAADALGGGGPVRPDPSWAAPWLIEALKDNYPIVRFFATSGLARWSARFEKPDYLNPVACSRAVDRSAAWIDPQVRLESVRLVEMMRARRSDVDIEVGE